jgi:hypothetical protein
MEPDRPAHDADHPIADRKAAPVRRLLDGAQRFVAQHQPLLARGSPAVLARHDFAVGAADAERARTSKAPSESGGSAISSNCAEFAWPGRTVIARMGTG